MRNIETSVHAPGLHEVRLKVTAVGINRAESMWRNDQYIEPARFLAGLGYDAVGIVDAVGKDVTDFAAGDTVSTTSTFPKSQCFRYGEVILVPDHAVVKHPKSLSFIKPGSVIVDLAEEGDQSLGSWRHYRVKKNWR